MNREMAPDAVRVDVIGEYRLRIEFDNGEIRDFDATPLLSRKCYASLRNKALFNTAYIRYGVVTWEDESDIDPDWLYEDSSLVSSTAARA